MKKTNILLPADDLIHVDLCVLGGSCTGLFAAVRAARLGLKVALVEKQNSFGGVATHAFVTVWHTLMDMQDKKQIIAGLTDECLDRLSKRGALQVNPESRAVTYIMNTEELKIELDLFVREEKNITPFLHTSYCAPIIDDAEPKGVVVNGKSGLGIIYAERFIDATGDGDLLRDLPCETWLADDPQPPTPGMKISGMKNISEQEITRLVAAHAKEVGIQPDWGWGTPIPGAPDIFYFAPTHVRHVNCADTMSLTYAEIESRRHARAIMDLLQKYYPNEHTALVGLGSFIGGRESRHVRCLYSLTEKDILGNRSVPDAIANGTYPCDVHSNDDLGITWKYLDGKEVYRRAGCPEVVRSWLQPGQTAPNYYQLPLGVIIPKGLSNVFAAGRMVDADQTAFGAIRVMVNLNQLGEAAGVAAYDSLNRNVPIDHVSAKNIKKLLMAGGSAKL
jgi:hypothetical protein